MQAARLDLMLQLRILQRIDLGAMQAAFVKAAPSYVAAYDLDVADVRDDFIAVGVPPDVVAIVTAKRTGTATGVSAADATAHVLARTSPFTTNDIIGSTNASRGTVTKVLKQLLKAGKVDAKMADPSPTRWGDDFPRCPPHRRAGPFCHFWAS